MSPGLQIALTSFASIVVPLAVAWLTVRGPLKAKQTDRTIAAEARSAEAQGKAYDALQEDLTSTRIELANARQEATALRTEMDATAKRAREQVDAMWAQLREYREQATAQARDYQSEVDRMHEHIQLLKQWIAEGKPAPGPDLPRKTAT